MSTQLLSKTKSKKIYETDVVQSIDNYVKNARIHLKWDELRNAVELAASLKVNSTEKVYFVFEGWSTNPIKTRIIIRKFFQENSHLLYRVKVSFRKDVKDAHGFFFGFFGFQINVWLRNKIDQLTISAESLKLEFENYLIVQSEQKNILETNLDSVKTIFSPEPNEINSWYVFLMRFPYNAVYLLEIINAREIAQSLLSKIINTSVDLPFEKDLFTFLVRKLTLISRARIQINEDQLFMPKKVDLDPINDYSFDCPGYSPVKIDKNFFTFIKNNSTRKLIPGSTELQDVYVRSNGRIVQSNHILTFENSDDFKLDFVAGRWHNEVGSISNFEHVVSTKINEAFKVDEAIHLISRADGNWFHWLVETLPRYLLISEKVNQQTPIIVSERITKQAQDSLSLMSNREIIKCKDFSDIRIKKLFLPGPVIFHPDTSEIPWQARSDVNIDVLTHFKNSILRRGTIVPQKKKRIFLIRESNKRQLVNQEEIKFLLEKKYDFECIDPEKLSFLDQVSITSQASMMIFAGGAAMANLIFLPENSNVILLQSDLLVEFSMPAILAGVAGANFYQVIGKAHSNKETITRQDLFHSNFSIDKGSLINAMRYITSKEKF